MKGNEPCYGLTPSFHSPSFHSCDQVPQTYNDPVGIRVGGKGAYAIDANITQTYACWDSGQDSEKTPPTMTAGPFTYSGSGSKKY